MSREYLNYLETVVDMDVEGLVHKEKSYGDSWKRSGGRSAWFMVRRKLDRLLNIMQRPEEPINGHLTYDFLYDSYFSEDIFLKIKQEERDNKASGADGTVLAEIRDIRRYLILVEAELIARGVINPNKWEKDDESLHSMED